MAHALTQMPVQIVQLLTEPDILPTFQYLFEKEHGPVPFEDSDTSSDVEPQVDSEDEKSLDMVFCEDQETTSDATGQVKSEVEVLKDMPSCEDSNTHFDVRTEVNSEEEGVIDIVSGVEEVFDVVSCEEFNTTSDVKAEVKIEEKGVTDIFSFEGKDVDAPSFEDFEEPVVSSDAAVAIPSCEPRIKEFSIPLEKLRFTRNCINKRVELEEDEYIFCSQCDKLRIGNCSVHGSLKWVKEPTDVFEKEGLTKARSTIPSNMDLKTSSIPDAGLGIFAKEGFESDVVFGPYWGQKIGVADVTPSMDQSYMWDIIENGRVTHVIDARDEKYSNWLRFVNCARNDVEQNLVAFQFRGEIYYRSFKTIEPGMELLVWYGDRYACDLDILNKDESEKMADGPIQCQKCFMVCSGPSSLATHNKFRCQINNEHHLWRCIHCDRSFKTPQSLQRHKNIHKGLKPYACRICGKVFSHSSSRRRHYSMHFNMICSCKMCGMVFHNTISLESHEQTVHAFKRISNGKFECTECEKVFANWKYLRRHKKRSQHKNAGAFTCKTCGKLFRKKDNLLRHEALHKPSCLREPYKCQHCGRCFLSGISLSNHKRIHLNKNVNEDKSDQGGSSPKTTPNSVKKSPKKGFFVVGGKKYSTHHICQICKAPFAYSFNLARHIREKHPRVKIIKCGKCAKVCVSKRELALHIAMKHETRKDDSKQFSLESVKCSQCNVTFPKCQLLNHTCIYQKAKANEGTTAQNFESKRTLQASGGKYNVCQSPLQNQTTSSSMEFRCDFCDKGFPSLSLMHCHRAVHFREKNASLPVSLGVSSKASCKESPCIYQKVLMNNCPTAQDSESKKTVQASDEKYSISQSSSQDQTTYNSEEFKCEFCAKGFPSLTLMYCHRAVHFRKKNHALLNPFGISSVTPDKETPHLEKAQPRNRQFRCGVCCKEFSSLKLLHCHKGCPLRKIKQFREMSCDRCNKQFNSKESLRQHKCYHAENAPSSSWSSVKRVKTSAVHCKICNKSFHKQTSLRSHMTHHARNAGQSNHLSPPIPLPKASKFQTEDKHFQWDICAKEFNSSDSLRSHRSHHFRFGKMQVTLPKQVVDANAQEPHVCNVCCESFRSSRSLSQHKRSHAGIKTAFACPFCRRGFSLKHSLLRHKKSQHDRPYKCQRCGEGFRTVQGRRRHLMKHESIKLDDKCSSSTDTVPAKCEALTFPPICCLHCDKRFMTSKGRYKHMRKYHSEESKVGLWKCPNCSKVFQNESAMKKHVKNKHPKRKRSEDQQGCKKEDKNGIETTSSKVAERTHACSEANTIAPWKCEFCSKVFQSVSGMIKHVKKKHPNRKRSEDQQGCKKEDKNGIETTSSKVAERTHACSEANTIAPWKCEFCSKVFQSVSGMIKHVKKKHPNRKRSEDQQGCKKEDKNGIETTSSKVAERTHACSEANTIAPWKCEFCSKVFQSVSGMIKHVKKKHSKRRKSEASHQECKPEEKDGIETTNSKVCQRAQSWSEWVKSAPWKCQFCSKVCQSVGDLQKHVKKKHSKRRKSEASHQGCKLEEKDVIETNNSKVTQRTQSWSEWATASPWKCQFCSKVCRSVSDMQKHIKKKHSKWRKSEASRQGSKLEEKDFIETNNSKVTQRTQSWSECANVSPWKCRFCSKVFQSVSGMKKHVKKKHSKSKRNQSPGQQYKQEGQHGTEVSSSETANAAQDVCLRCGVRFFAFGSHNKCVYCVHCNRELSLEGNDNGSEFGDEFVGSGIQDRMQKKESPLLASARAFQCQYCQKGVSKINSLYKHIMIAHEKEFGSNDHDSCTRFGNQSEWKNDSAHQAFQNCEEGCRLARNRNAQPRGVKFSTVRRKAGTLGAKRTAQCNRFRCRDTRRDVLSRDCRRRLGIKSHENELGSSSLLPKLDVDNISKPLHKKPRLSKDKNSRKGKSRACIDGPHVKEYNPRNKAFPCEYCPKQFLRVTSRYRHVLLVHSGATNATSKNFQLKPQVPADKTGETLPLFCSDQSIRSSSTPMKRKKDISNLDCQPENRKFRRHDVNFGSGGCAGMRSFNRQPVTRSKAFPCKFCDKRFSSFSLQCKHVFLVHSGSQALADQGVMNSKTTTVMKVSKLQDSFNAACNEIASTFSHGNPARRPIFPPQRNILRSGSSDAKNGLEMPSMALTTSEPYKCEICCTTFRTKSEWTKHFDEMHYRHTSESLCNIKRFPRQPLRTISWSLQSRNNLKSLRKRHVSFPKATCGKQVEVSIRPGIFVESKFKKRFKCEICHSSFTEKHSVLRHMKSRHNDEKPFQCVICGYATKRKDSLSKHERSHLS